MFHKLCSSLGHSVVDHEFNVNDSIIYIKDGNKVSLTSETCKTKLRIDWLMKIRPQAHIFPGSRDFPAFPATF